MLGRETLLTKTDLRPKRALSVAGVAQLVERQVVVLDVTGSRPVVRPKTPKQV